MTSANGSPTIDRSTRSGDAENAGLWTIPNLLTMFRIALTFPFLYLVNEGRFGTALAVFFLASLTDFADGFLARRLNQRSRLGRFLDPLADKLLISAAFVVMAVPHTQFASIPVWLAVVVVGRDVVIVLGALIVYSLTRFKEFTPTLLGKMNTFAELGLIVWFLVFHTTGRFIFLLPYMYAIIAASVALSGTEYLIRGANLLRQRPYAS
jgi:cardiolipin synthase (CMP-forming)